MNSKNILINMVTLGILIFAIMSMIIIIQSDNDLNSNNRITNNTLINESYGDLESKLDQQSSAKSSEESLYKSPPQDYIGDLSILSIISTTLGVGSIVSGLWNLYIKLPMAILGVSPLIASAINTILIILLVIGAWAIWKGAIS